MAAIPNRGPQLQAVCITLLVTALITTCLRCFTRLHLIKAFGLDDWLMVFACISYILFVTCAITGIHYGTGRHAVDLSTADFQEAMKYWWFCYVWYCVTMICSKISIGVFLLRIAILKVHRLIIYGLLCLTVFTGLVFFFVTLFQCHPISYFWYKVGNEGTCIDVKIIAALTYLYSAFSVICDFTFALLPIHIIQGLQMDRRVKLALIPILSIACVLVCYHHLVLVSADLSRASVAVVVRFAYIKDFENPDFLWATVDIAIWSNTEQGLAITAGSLATLKPLIKRGTGLWSSRASTLPASNNDFPRTIGSQGKFRGQMASDKGLFSLSTFTRMDDEEAERDNGDRFDNNHIVHTTTITIKEEAGSSSEKHMSKSEGALTPDSWKTTHGGYKSDSKEFLATRDT
ncbi:hypothetical protein BJ170DRAFT_245328 [Xylariales sp. AK1849]|nr:hypothetical protein BJ170DRAFT_245328 [Xylariales sp. AK1849]